MPGYDRYRLRGAERIRFWLLSGLLMAGVGYLFYKSIIVSLIFTGLIYPGEKYYCNYLAAKRRRELSFQFRDLLYAFSSSFATGRLMREALEEAREDLNLIYDAESLICTELEIMVKRMTESKESEEELLRDFAERSHIADIHSFADIYSICRTTGGNMEKVIMKAIDVLLDKIDIEREIHKLTAQKRAEAYILTAIPFLVIIFLQLSSPDYFNVMYETLAGRLLMTITLVCVFISYLWSMKITQIEI